MIWDTNKILLSSLGQTHGQEDPLNCFFQPLTGEKILMSNGEFFLGADFCPGIEGPIFRVNRSGWHATVWGHAPLPQPSELPCSVRAALTLLRPGEFRGMAHSSCTGIYTSCPRPGPRTALICTFVFIFPHLQFFLISKRYVLLVGILENE